MRKNRPHEQIPQDIPSVLLALHEIGATISKVHSYVPNVRTLRYDHTVNNI